MKRHIVDEWKNVNVKINGTVINVDVHEQGFYTDGDAWGEGTEPPDFSVEITEVRYKADGITEAQVREALEYGEVTENE